MRQNMLYMSRDQGILQRKVLALVMQGLRNPSHGKMTNSVRGVVHPVYPPDLHGQDFPKKLTDRNQNLFNNKLARPRSYASLKLRLTDWLTYLLTDEGKDFTKV